MGQKWYQSLALSLLFSADIYQFYLKGQYALKSIKLVSAFNDSKNLLCKINVVSAENSLYCELIFRIPSILLS